MTDNGTLLFHFNWTVVVVDLRLTCTPRDKNLSGLSHSFTVHRLIPFKWSLTWPPYAQSNHKNKDSKADRTLFHRTHHTACVLLPMESTNGCIFLRPTSHWESNFTYRKNKLLSRHRQLAREEERKKRGKETRSDLSGSLCHSLNLLEGRERRELLAPSLHQQHQWNHNTRDKRPSLSRLWVSTTELSMPHSTWGVLFGAGEKGKGFLSSFLGAFQLSQPLKALVSCSLKAPARATGTTAARAAAACEAIPIMRRVSLLVFCKRLLLQLLDVNLSLQSTSFFSLSLSLSLSSSFCLLLTHLLTFQGLASLSQSHVSPSHLLCLSLSLSLADSVSVH